MGKLSSHVGCDSCDKDSEIDRGVGGEPRHPGSRAATAPSLSAVIAEVGRLPFPGDLAPVILISLPACLAMTFKLISCLASWCG